MTKAEKAGLKAYPENISYSTIGDVMYDYNAEKRRVYVAGYEQGYYKDAIEKACEWLEKRQLVDLEVPNIEKFINDFRKDMEEQQ